MENNELELSWIMRLRVTAALAIGICLLGFIGYDLLAGADPLEPVIFAAGSISISAVAVCIVLAFVTGALASAAASPYGRQIGPIAAPAGMAFWALKTTPLAKAFQLDASAEFKIQTYSAMQFEGFIWAAVAGAGLAGALVAAKIIPHKTPATQDDFKPVFKLPAVAVIVIAVIGSVFIADKIISLTARDVSFADAELSTVFSTAGNKQICFGVIAGFAGAGFLAKLLIGADFLWPGLASVPLVYYISMRFGSAEIANYLSSNWPPVFFAKPVAAILPLQIVSFGSLGAILGYWLAARYHKWRTQEQ